MSEDFSDEEVLARWQQVRRMLLAHASGAAALEDMVALAVFLADESYNRRKLAALVGDE